MSKFALYAQPGSLKSNQAWTNLKKIAAAVYGEVQKNRVYCQPVR